jgi:hypothetical protein
MDAPWHPQGQVWLVFASNVVLWLTEFGRTPLAVSSSGTLSRVVKLRKCIGLSADSP